MYYGYDNNLHNMTRKGVNNMHAVIFSVNVFSGKGCTKETATQVRVIWETVAFKYY
jgi:hypothetical protein